MSIHDKILQDLEQRILNSDYTSCYKNLNYCAKSGKLIGEIDLLAVKETKKNYLLLFEVKGGDHNRRKADNQLRKEEKYFENDFDRIFKFYVYKPKRGKDYKIVWERKI